MGIAFRSSSYMEDDPNYTHEEVMAQYRAEQSEEAAFAAMGQDSLIASLRAEIVALKERIRELEGK